MSISIFYIIIIGFVTLIYSGEIYNCICIDKAAYQSLKSCCSGMCFRCYVCNSNSDKHCEHRPTFTARCPHSADGCVKIVNELVEYNYTDSNGKEITAADWDGSETSWEAVPYVRTIVTRRCGNNYARYHPRSGCSTIPLSRDNGSKEMLCYCRTELCNGVTKGETNEFLSSILLIFIPLYAY